MKPPGLPPGANKGNCETSLVEFRKGRLKTTEPPGRGSLKARDGRLPNLSPLRWEASKGP